MSKRKRTAAPSSERGRRVLAGLAKARAYGVKLGRPKVSTKAENAVRRHLARGIGILRTARLVGVGSGTVQRIKAELAART
jgi:DNA invertase Pin-like site-specific DNA recombinase